MDFDVGSWLIMSKKTCSPNGVGNLQVNRSFTHNYVNDEKYLCFLRDSGPNLSHALSASYKGNRIKLNYVLSHFFQALGTNLTSSNTNLTKIYREVKKHSLVILKIHSLTPILKEGKWYKHTASYLYVKVLGILNFYRKYNFVHV